MAMKPSTFFMHLGIVLVVLGAEVGICASAATVAGGIAQTGVLAMVVACYLRVAAE